jgi:hypothetical protein
MRDEQVNMQKKIDIPLYNEVPSKSNCLDKVKPIKKFKTILNHLCSVVPS